jgi:hypothetical protein
VKDISVDVVVSPEARRDRPLDQHEDRDHDSHATDRAPHGPSESAGARYEIFLGLATEKRS